LARAVAGGGKRAQLAALGCGSTVGMVAKMSEVWPASMSVIAGTLPL
jgi:hypothetical protein